MINEVGGIEIQSKNLKDAKSSIRPKLIPAADEQHLKVMHLRNLGKNLAKT